jgi:prevent-host-death family protein
MITVNMHEAKSQLSKLVERVGRGATIIIARDGEPAAMLVPIPSDAKGTWSASMRSWLKDGDPVDFTISRSDLGPVKRRKLF